MRNLDEFDEVPLFFRSKDVEFLTELPDHTRSPLMLEVALSEVDRVARTLNAMAGAAEYFMCLTLQDWDLLGEQGQQVVPTPSLLVSPKWRTEILTPRFAAPSSNDARQVASWIKLLGRSDLETRESVVRADSPRRIYVGYSAGVHRFRSIGDFGPAR